MIDGGSTDETTSILKKHEDRLRWVSEQDKGQADAINKGILATTGEIIGWLNSDDIYYPGALRTILDFFDSQQEADVVYGDANHIDENDRIIEPYPTEPWNIERLRETCYLCQPATFFRREVVNRFGLLDENLAYCMDYEYWLRLAHGGAKFAHLRRVLAGSRFYPSTKTLRARVPVHAEINTMMLRRFGKVPDRWIFNYAHVCLEKIGMSRRNRWLFVPALIVVSLYSSLRWNKKITLTMFPSMGRWFLEALKGMLGGPSRRENRI